MGQFTATVGAANPCAGAGGGQGNSCTGGTCSHCGGGNIPSSVSFTPTGFASGVCTDCTAKVNKLWTLTNTGDCVWTSSTFTLCGTTLTYSWQLSFDGTTWTLKLIKGGLTSASWSLVSGTCAFPKTLTFVSSADVACTSYPATITINCLTGCAISVTELGYSQNSDSLTGISVPAGELLIVTVGHHSSTAADFTGCTYNGVPMTLAVKGQNTDLNGQVVKAAIYYLLVPTAVTSADVVVQGFETDGHADVISAAYVSCLAGNVLDKTSSKGTAGSSVDTGLSPLTTAANEYVQALGVSLDNSNTIGGWAPPFSAERGVALPASGGGYNYLLFADAFAVVTTPGQQEATGTQSHSINIGVLATFK